MSWIGLLYFLSDITGAYLYIFINVDVRTINKTEECPKLILFYSRVLYI